MKLEPRGKFGGVKVHLDSKECQSFMDYAKEIHGKGGLINQNLSNPFQMTVVIGTKIAKLLAKHPDLLEDKSEDHIKEILMSEAEKAQAKLDLLNKGSKWDPKKGLEV